ncbi:hypothetical protein B0T25DRAFT_145742 [Lasiosphaeria hispida]|uniref:Uncharacterized protein n=1 Tax=Lasiosphaeria hispida TaxID=260671 RepID=A0AAJ0HM14_9PEZI|nr:hypothetical protein B0T25DRAFT_145742 [Lasiosphaeria hispida]
MAHGHVTRGVESADWKGTLCGCVVCVVVPNYVFGRGFLVWLTRFIPGLFVVYCTIRSIGYKGSGRGIMKGKRGAPWRGTGSRERIGQTLVFWGGGYYASFILVVSLFGVALVRPSLCVHDLLSYTYMWEFLGDGQSISEFIIYTFTFVGTSGLYRGALP